MSAPAKLLTHLAVPANRIIYIDNSAKERERDS